MKDRDIQTWPLPPLILMAALAVFAASPADAAEGKKNPSAVPIQPAIPMQVPAAKPPPAVSTKALPVQASAVPVRTPAATVTAGGTSWRCASRRCSANGGLELARVDACQALAREVGRIESYSFSGGTFNSAQLGECNRVVLAAATQVQAAAPMQAAAATPVTVEANYIARAVRGSPGASAPAGPPIAVEANYIARVTGAPSATAPAGPAIAVESNFIARDLQASARTSGGSTAVAPITVEANYVARSLRR